MAGHATVDGRDRTMWYLRNPNPVSYPSGSGGFQNHHILPCASVRDSLLESNKTEDNLLKAVKYFSTWNINKGGAGGNMKMLPTVPVFQRAWGTTGAKKTPGVLPPEAIGCPCHDRNHPAYTEKVQTDLTKIWSKVKAKVNKHNVITSAADIGPDLTKKKNKHKKRIAKRATTQANWQKVYANSATALKIFSML